MSRYLKRATAGQVVYFTAIDATGAPVTSGSGTRSYVLGNAAAVSTSPGAFAHKANGLWTYVTTLADTDAASVGCYTFTVGASVPDHVEFRTDSIDLLTEVLASGIIGTVAASPAPTPTSFKLQDLPVSLDAFGRQYLEFTSGTLDGLARPIATFTPDSPTSGIVTLTPPNALPSAPVALEKARIVGFRG